MANKFRNHQINELDAAKLLGLIAEIDAQTGSTAWRTGTGTGDLSTVDIDTLAELNAILTDATLIDTTDSRLSDSRTPIAHTHAPSELIVTGTKDATTFLRGDDVWAVPGATDRVLKPILSNFRVEDANLDRVLFDASADITGMASTGFTISGKTISSLTIDGDGLGGYFTVSVAFTFWDNNTIRLESGDGTVYDFTLTYITNNIVEPTAATIRYASATGSGSNSGLDQSNEWTYQQAFTNATSGMTVYLKAGNSTSGVVCSASGTSSSPIKFIGYKTTPNDINTNYYDYTVKGSTGVTTTEMPTLTGASKTSGIGVAFGGYDYIIIKNLQVEQFYYQFHSRATNNPSNYIVMERVNGHDSGAIGSNDAHGVVFRSYDPTISYYIGSNNIRLKNSTFINHTQGSVVITGDGSCLLDNVKTYSDKYETDPERNDYHIAIGGWDNIIKDCYSENFNNTTTNLSTHGIGIRGAEQWDYTGKVGSQYNLIVGSESVNSYDGLYFRNYRSDNNVAKNNIVRGNGNFLAERSGGLGIMSGCDNNIFENNYVENVYWATYWTDNSEDGSSDTHTGDNNIIRNNIFKNCRDQIWVTATANTTAVNNKYYNNTFYSTNSNGFGYAGFYQDADGGTYDNGISGWEFKNNLVTVHYEHASVPSGITSLADYNNFDGAYTGFGTNKTTLNPNFVDLVDFVPQETLLKAGTPLTGVEYDYDNTERENPPTIGAKDIITTPTAPTYSTDIHANIAALDLVSGTNTGDQSAASLGLVIGTDVQAHSAILDATTASYTTAEETKLSGIATGAEVNTINSTVSGEPTGSDVVTNIVSLTQAEYDAGSPVSTTHYLITDADPLGQSKVYTAGEILVAGDWCYLKSDGKMWKSDASVEATSKGMIRMATESIAADATGYFAKAGDYTTTGLTAGSTYYLSETAGAITATVPVTSLAIVRVIGYATSTTNLEIEISQSYIELA